MSVVLYNTNRGIVRSGHSAEHVQVLDTSFDSIASAVQAGAVRSLAEAPVEERVPRDAVKLAPLLSGPVPIVAVGLNYRSHAAELGIDPPADVIAERFDGTASYLPAGDDVVLPSESREMVDYEGELCAVMGGHLSGGSSDDAWKALAGITAANDVTARDVQAAGIEKLDFLTAKTFPTFKPIGPGLIVPTDAHELVDLELEVRVNGELRQRCISEDMVRPVLELLVAISEKLPLTPGDLVLTGSAGGVGFLRGMFLRSGDVVEVSIPPMEPLTNKVR